MSAPPVRVGSTHVVPLVSGHFNYQSSVTALANGQSVITWSDWVNNPSGGYLQRVNARLIDAYGNQVGSTISVDNVTNGSGAFTNYSPVVTSLSDGGFIIAFNLDYSSSDTDVFCRRYNANGSAVSGILSINGISLNTYVNDAIGLAGGGWVVSYTNTSTGAGDVFADIFNSAGILIGNDIAIGLNNASAQGNAQMAALSNGNFVVAYNSTSGTDQNVLYRIVNASGSAVLVDQVANRVITGAGGAPVNQTVGSVTALSNGGFAIAYTSEFANRGTLASNDFDVLVELFSSAGAWLSTVTVDANLYMQYEPSIVGLPDGTFSVTYSDRASEGGNAANQHTRIYTNAGTYLSEITPLNTTTPNSQLFPNTAVLSDGRMITTWTEFGGGNVEYTIVDSRTRASDYGGNGTADIFWRNSATGENVIWQMNGSTVTNAAFTSQGATLSSYWRPVAGASDFNNDGRNDVLWRGNGGELIIWNLNGSTVQSPSYVTNGGNQVVLDNYWTVAGTGNFGGSPNSDILWRGAGGEIIIWDMNGSAIQSAGYVTLGGNTISLDSYWNVAGVADFNGDSRSDILWRGAGGEIIIWTMNGTAIQSAAYVTLGGNNLSLNSSWAVAGVGDFGGDGRADILWRNASTGDNYLWQMNGSQVAAADSLRAGGNAINLNSYWSIGEVADFTGDTRMDILWRGAGNELIVWGMNNNNLQTANYVTLGGNNLSLSNTWQVV